MNVIDLRSDTVTKPTAAMRQAMAEAVVGDDVADVDPTVRQLEERTAELLGKEAAIFVPSGTMANQIALRVHCPHGSSFVCEADSHLIHYEQGSFAALAGLIPKTIATYGGTIRAQQLEGVLGPDDPHFTRTRLLCLENTHNRWGGRVLDQVEVVAVSDWAKSNGLATHLDGARLWNASITNGIELADLVSPFDSVSVCFSKGLGAPVGSAVVGSNAFIAEARRARKLLGGAMRQSGIIAAGALYALEHHRERLAEDHAAARKLGATIESIEGFHVRGAAVESNMVTFRMEKSRAGEFVEQLSQRGVQCYDIGPDVVRMVTHLDVSNDQIHQACQIIQETAEKFEV